MVRPLLRVHKQELEEYCRGQGLPFVVDPTNSELSFHRNRIRHVLHSVPGPGSPAAESMSMISSSQGSDNGSMQGGDARTSISSTSSSSGSTCGEAGSLVEGSSVPQVVQDILRLQNRCAAVAAIQWQQAERLLRVTVLHTSSASLPSKQQQEYKQPGYHHSSRQHQHSSIAGLPREQQAELLQRAGGPSNTLPRQQSEQAQLQQQPGQPPREEGTAPLTEPKWMIHWPQVLPEVAAQLSPLRFSLLRVPRLAEANESVALAALSRILQATSGSPYPPSHGDTWRLWLQLRGGKLAGGFTGGACLVRPVPRSKGRYALCVALEQQQEGEALVRHALRRSLGGDNDAGSSRGCTGGSEDAG